MALSTQNKLYIAVAVLAVLGGAVYFQNKKQQEEAISYSPEGAAELPKLEISEEASNKVTKITIQRPAGDAGPATEVVLEKKGEEWRLTTPVDYKANENNVKSLLGSLKRIKVAEAVASGTDSYQAFGVSDELALHAVFHEGDKVVADLYFGEGGTRGQMARIAGHEGVFAVQGYSSFSFSRDVKGWRDTEIFTFDDKLVTSLEITNEHGTFTFVRQEKKPEKKDDKKKGDKKKGDEKKDDADAEKKDDKKDAKKEYTWVGKFKPAGGGAAKPIDDFEEAKVKDALRAFKGLKADAFGDDKQAADVGLAEPMATVTIVLEDGARKVLQVGDNAEGTSRWVKKADAQMIFSIASGPAGWATAEVEKFQKSDDDDKPAPRPPGGMGMGMPGMGMGMPPGH